MGDTGGSDAASSSSDASPIYGPNGTDGTDGARPVELRFDVAGPTLEPEYVDPSVPPDCERAAREPSSMGCLFYAVDLDQSSGGDLAPFAVVLGNVQTDTPATVTVEVREAQVWQLVTDPVTIDPLDTHAITLPDWHQDGSGVLSGGAYRIRSDVPVSAVQFSPLQGLVTGSSEAALLMPTTSWTSDVMVMGWVTEEESDRAAYFTAIAAADGTPATVTPRVNYLPGAGVPPGPSNVPFRVRLDQGDIVQVTSANSAGNELEFGLSGSTVRSGQEHPIAVFSAHTCASIPVGRGPCSHVQEMISPDHFGQRFVAPRLPIRDPIDPEPTLWQILALKDSTQVTFQGTPGTTGLPPTPVILQSGDVYQAYIGGPTDTSGDLAIESDRPISVAAYMINAANPPASPVGGAAMVQLAPVDRFFPRYVFYVPDGWFYNYVSLTRRTGQSVVLDGIQVPNAAFSPVGGDHEVATLPLLAGPHVLSGLAPFGALVTGIGLMDAYAYLAGSGRPVIANKPEG